MMYELEFGKLAEEKGYGETEQGYVDPGLEEEMHTHNYSVLPLILAGEFVLTTQDGTTILKAGDWCEIPADTLHKKQTGSEVGSYLVAKKGWSFSKADAGAIHLRDRQHRTPNISATIYYRVGNRII